MESRTEVQGISVIDTEPLCAGWDSLSTGQLWGFHLSLCMAVICWHICSSWIISVLSASIRFGEVPCPCHPAHRADVMLLCVISAPAQLGPLRKIRLWHDSRGPSPSWFISHVMVKELHSGQSWFFPAQCWLAADQWDGHVERELTRLRHGLGFQKLFYSKFTEYLEDFHVWLSVYSRPSSSGYLHTQRLTVSFCLLCVYAFLAVLVTAGEHEQLPLDVGPTDITLRSFSLGFLCTLLASPGSQLLALLFRLSKVPVDYLHGPMLLSGTSIAGGYPL
ncbi:Hypothetical predicted protein [Marmota monax]|uniref:PLAT domain-containing protein n=1 Tax=Marmota monax TaxID=9995 RepID=A0A5E4CXV1_MARMO|nr:hypothetical protein GHT09_018388 [Marmota monax]VTJ86627.1 Hypothetical predicted protein [Marmota monax]